MVAILPLVAIVHEITLIYFIITGIIINNQMEYAKNRRNLSCFYKHKAKLSPEITALLMDKAKHILFKNFL